MAIVDPLSQAFLYLERSHRPMHVGGLQLFALPKDAPPDYVPRLANRIRADNRVQPPFNQRLKFRFSQPFWVVDDNYDVASHVRHLTLPPPGTTEDLLALVSKLHGARLDRARPLWESYIIEGLYDNRFAIYTKFHHAMMDGASAVRVMRRFLSPQANATHFDLPWQLPSQPQRPSWHAIANGYRQASALPATVRALRESWRDAYKRPDFTGPAQAPPCILNAPISGSRQFVAQGYSLARIRAVATIFGATRNDVVLALCAAALRRYLSDHNALPAAPLIALVPVSLHDGDEAAGNRLGLLYANLATHIADPVRRFKTIKRSVDYWKRRYRTMTAEQIMAFAAALSAPAGANLLTGLAPRRQSFNILISNIPGSEGPLYFGDARLLDIYPLSIVVDGQALNISLMRYSDTLEFGLTACPYALPSIQKLLQYLAEALDELTAYATRVDLS